MSEERGYNGWSNYETWNVALWLDNDGCGEEYRERAKELMQEALDDDEREPKDTARGKLADAIQAAHDEAMPEGLTGTFSDLLGAALSNVNWREIAEHYVDEIDVYCAGWNMPGYMPDNTPAQFLDFDDARSYIAESIEQSADAEADDDVTTACAEAVEWVNAQTKDFTANIGNYAYWVSKA